VVAAMALAWLPPLDLPTGGGDLADGVEAEHTGARLAVLRLALAGATATFYLGGWLVIIDPQAKRTQEHMGDRFGRSA